MPEPHRQCASVLIQNEQNEVLLVHQTYGPKFFGFPGGIVDLGETPPQAAVREALEEIGVNIALDYQIGAYLLTGGGWPDIFASVYKARIVKGEPKPDLQEIASIVWCSVDNLPLPLLPDVEAAVEDYRKGKRAVVRTYQRKAAIPKWRDVSSR